MARRHRVTFEQVSVTSAQDLLQINGASSSVASVNAVAAAGSGYVVGDMIMLSGGNFTRPAILKVATISGSGVATATIVDSGSYGSTPSNPLSQAGTSGSGTGATFNMTWVTVSKLLKILRQWLECADTTLPTAQFMPLRCRKLGATVANGSGGGTPNISKEPGDPLPTFTALSNNTSKASTNGEIDIHHDGGMYVFSGHEKMYDRPPEVRAGEAFVFELLAGLAGGTAVKLSGGIEVEEEG